MSGCRFYSPSIPRLIRTLRFNNCRRRQIYQIIFQRRHVITVSHIFTRSRARAHTHICRLSTSNNTLLVCATLTSRPFSSAIIRKKNIHDIYIYIYMYTRAGSSARRRVHHSPSTLHCNFIFIIFFFQVTSS